MSATIRYPIDTLRLVEFESDSEDAPAPCFAAAGEWLGDNPSGVVGVCLIYGDGRYVLQLVTTEGEEQSP